MEIPDIGSTIEIVSLKHDQKLHRRWEENIVLYSDDDLVIGGNDCTTVEESTGKRWRTTEPAIFYFDRRFWFNIIMLLKGNEYYYYCNLSSPFTYKNERLQYIDYDIDVIVESDFTYKIVDEADFEVNRSRFHYPKEVELAIAKNLAELQTWIEERKSPFNNAFLDYWHAVFHHNGKN